MGLSNLDPVCKVTTLSPSQSMINRQPPKFENQTKRSCMSDMQTSHQVLPWEEQRDRLIPNPRLTPSIEHDHRLPFGCRDLQSHTPRSVALPGYSECRIPISSLVEPDTAISLPLQPTATENLPKIDSESNSRRLSLGVAHEFLGKLCSQPQTTFEQSLEQEMRPDLSTEVSRTDDRATAEDLGTTTRSSRPGSQYSLETSDSSGSDESSCPSSGHDLQLGVLHMKHALLNGLMHEFYAIFDRRWTANVQTHTRETSSTGPVPSQRSPDHKNSMCRKRQRHDRDQTPPDDRSKRNRNNEKSSTTPEENRLFACPFHRYDRNKYCCSVVDGPKYRACAGPGFTTISRLK